MFDLIKFILEKIFIDTNLTEIEKAINTYKIERKKYLLLVFTMITYPTMIIYLSYLITTKFPHIFLITVLGSVILTICAFLFKKHLMKFVYILFYLVFPLFLTTSILEMYFEGFNLQNFFLAILLASFLLVVYSSVYIFTKGQVTTKEDLRLTFVLSEGEEIEAYLISVTKNGDYIIKVIGNDDKEVLLIKDYIKKIIYHKKTK